MAEFAAGTPVRPTLRRTIGPVQLALYGLGGMLGSGIYALIGRAAGEAGNAVWLAFLVALVPALLTGLSYASLGSRYPRAGGVAYVSHRAFGSPLLTFTVGVAVICSGLTSIATQARVFAANLTALPGVAGIPLPLLALGFLLILTGVVLRGIRESMWVNVACTLVEASGLLLVIVAGASHVGTVDLLEVPTSPADLPLLAMQGAILTFFAFIGFEDTVNVAEECRNPQRTIPIGLVTALALAALLYMAVAVVAVSVVPWRALQAAPNPLAAVMSTALPGFPPAALIFITLFAVANTALVNYVTASRLVYGMARQKMLPEFLGRVHARSRTPHLAILVLTLVLLPMVAFGDIGQLASATTLLLLAVFAVVNAALFVLHGRRTEPRGAFEVARLVPALGVAACVALIAARLAAADIDAPLLAGAMLVLIVMVYGLLRPKISNDIADQIADEPAQSLS